MIPSPDPDNVVTVFGGDIEAMKVGTEFYSKDCKRTISGMFLIYHRLSFEESCERRIEK